MAAKDKGLNPFEEKVVLHYIEHGCQTSAYKHASTAKRMADKTVHEKASRLFSRDKVKARIAELRGKVADKVTMDRAWVLEQLKENVLVCMGKKRIKNEDGEIVMAQHNPSAANTALKLIGQEIAGMFVDVSKSVDDDGKAVVPVVNVTIGTESKPSP